MLIEIIHRPFQGDRVTSRKWINLTKERRYFELHQFRKNRRTTASGAIINNDTRLHSFDPSVNGADMPPNKSSDFCRRDACLGKTDNFASLGNLHLLYVIELHVGCCVENRPYLSILNQDF